jgi:serine/threonine protein kinase
MTLERLLLLAQLALQEGWIDLNTYSRALLGLDRLPPNQLSSALTERFALQPAQIEELQSIAERAERGESRAQSLYARLLGLQREHLREGLAPGTGRYALGPEIGRGGGGRVVLGDDRYFGRRVALKLTLPEKSNDPTYVERFIAEAQATGSLEHPNIIPVYDIGTLPDGALFYAMKYVGQNSLRLVIHRLRLRKPETLAEYGLIRLLTLFNQVCMAVDYAHAKGVIHRDLKPENILLGDHGEIIVMDWGIAKFFGQHEESPLKRGQKTPANTVLGTPEYMAPEQAMGAAERPAVDIYALGIILYELLCLSPPFEDEKPVQVLLKAIKETPVPPSVRAQEHQRHVPADLEAIALRAIAKDPEARYPSAKALRDAIEAYIENRRDEERTRALAAERVHEAAQHVARLTDLNAGIDRLHAEIREARQSFEGWEPLTDKSHLWEAEAALSAQRNAAIEAFSAAESAYLQALAYDRDDPTARRGLAVLYWTRLRQAEQQDQRMDALYYHALIQRYDNGQLADQLRGAGTLHLQTVPPGAHLTLHLLAEQDLCLRPTTAWGPEPTPLAWSDVQMGRYLAELRLPGYATARVSFRVERRAQVHLHIPLLPEHTHPDDLVYIPPGPALVGGDPLAIAPLPRSWVHVDGFLLALKRGSGGSFPPAAGGTQNP